MDYPNDEDGNNKWVSDRLAAKGDEWNRKLKIEGNMRYLKGYASDYDIQEHFTTILLLSGYHPEAFDA